MARPGEALTLRRASPTVRYAARDVGAVAPPPWWVARRQPRWHCGVGPGSAGEVLSVSYGHRSRLWRVTWRREDATRHVRRRLLIVPLAFTIPYLRATKAWPGWVG